jgi:hypothetical protein
MAITDDYKLVTAEDGTEIRAGEPITDFRSDPDVFQYISKAPGGNSSGKIVTDRGGELYPSVFSLKIVPR